MKGSRWRVGAWVVVLAAAAEQTVRAAPAIEHQPLRCVVADTHPWIQARVAAAAVQARFRRLDSREWYTVRLTEEEDAWVGALPRPRASLSGFAYYLEATGTDAESARTPEQTVRVVAEESGCGTDGVGPSVPEATVVAEAPRGQPPLPKGFTEAQEDVAGGEKVGVFDISARTALVGAIGLGAVAAGVGLAISSQPPEVDRIELLSSSPPSGSTISLGTQALSVRVRVTSNRAVGAGSIVVSLRSAGSPGDCVTLWAAHPGIVADQPFDVSVERLLFVQCTPPFSTQQALATVRGPGEADAFGDDLPLAYSFVP